MDLHHIREDYSKQELSESQCSDSPFEQFERWLDEAVKAEANEPTAMNVATVGADGRPSARMVLLKEVNRNGFVFFSNYSSRKGQALAAHPFAALTFFWPGRPSRLHDRIRYRSENGAWIKERLAP